MWLKVDLKCVRIKGPKIEGPIGKQAQAPVL